MSTNIPLFDTPTFTNLIRVSKEDASSDVWNSDRWIKRQEEFLRESAEGIEPRANTLEHLLRSLEDQCQILDFGGGSGWLYHILQNHNVNFKEYINFESLDLHSKCEFVHINYQYVNLQNLGERNTLDSSSVLYLNSVVQYFESDKELLDLAKQLNPRYLVLDDVTFAQNKEFFSFQKYYETRIAYRFTDFRALITSMRQIGYKVIYENEYSRIINPQFSYEFQENLSESRIGLTKSLHFERFD